MASTSQGISPAANVEFMRAAFRGFNVGDTDGCLALAAPDLITHLTELPEAQHGREAWRQGFEMMKRAFPDLQAHIEDIFGEAVVCVPAQMAAFLMAGVVTSRGRSCVGTDLCGFGYV